MKFSNLLKLLGLSLLVTLSTQTTKVLADESEIQPSENYDIQSAVAVEPSTPDVPQDTPAEEQAPLEEEKQQPKEEEPIKQEEQHNSDEEFVLPETQSEETSHEIRTQPEEEAAHGVAENNHEAIPEEESAPIEQPSSSDDADLEQKLDNELAEMMS